MLSEEDVRPKDRAGGSEWPSSEVCTAVLVMNADASSQCGTSMLSEEGVRPKGRAGGSECPSSEACCTAECNVEPLCGSRSPAASAEGGGGEEALEVGVGAEHEDRGVDEAEKECGEVIGGGGDEVREEHGDAASDAGEKGAAGGACEAAEAEAAGEALANEGEETLDDEEVGEEDREDSGCSTGYT